jgi:hypothetical protein
MDSKCARACQKAHDECDLPGSAEQCIANCGRGDPKAKKQWTERVLGRSCAEIRDFYFEQK